MKPTVSLHLKTEDSHWHISAHSALCRCQDVQSLLCILAWDGDVFGELTCTRTSWSCGAGRPRFQTTVRLALTL
ncbi:Calpain-7 [Manis pentadactyla]|nr:Calpain-7 [Manis pentadactyla]